MCGGGFRGLGWWVCGGGVSCLVLCVVWLGLAWSGVVYTGIKVTI